VKTIIYAGDALTTGDDIAEAVLRYSKALAHSDTAETVEIPVVRSDGRRITATLLIGPASQIVAEEAPDSGHEIVDVELVESLNERARAVADPAAAGEESPPTSWVDDL
jgi:hypothetical protein